MKEWSAKVEGLHWRLAIKNRKLYGKLVGDTNRELLPLCEDEVRKKPDAERMVEVLVRGESPMIAEAKTRMVKASMQQLESSLGRRLHHLKSARVLIAQGFGDRNLEQHLSRSLGLCLEIIDEINEIPTD